MSTDPDPQNMFWGIIQKYIYILYSFEKTSTHVLGFRVGAHFKLLDLEAIYFFEKKNVQIKLFCSKNVLQEL